MKFTCQTCAKEFERERRPNYTPKFCSLACSVSRQKPTAEMEQRMVELYRGEFGIKMIGRKLGISHQVVRNALRRHGINPGQNPKPTRKDCFLLARRAGFKPKAIWQKDKLIARIQAESFASEWASVRKFDEQRHWADHIEVVRLQARKSAARHYPRRRLDPIWRLKRAVRTSVWQAIKDGQGLKLKRTFELVGCTPHELRQHLESQFELGMTWANYGTFWEVDHIKPLACFDLSQQPDQRRCFHFSNLRPLPVHDNRTKWAKYRNVKYLSSMGCRKPVNLNAAWPG